VVSLGTLKEGDVFREMWIISQSVRTANISALGDVTVGVIDKDTFEGVIKNLP
jgi:CRP/FNR family transcriptional regulator, cyclic AMP receptor protein